MRVNRCLQHAHRAGNLLIWFPSELLIFCPKMSKWAICSKKWAICSFLVSEMSDLLTWLISSERPEQIAHGHSFLVSEMSNSLTSLISSERPERIAHGCSFLVSDLSDLLTSLFFGEQPEQFAHIAHFWWATWAIRSHPSLKMREWANRSFF